MELLAAAHASCICGMVAYLLEDTGHPSDTLEAFAEVELEHRQGITGIRVSVRGVVPGLSTDEFTAIVRRAKDGCPVSKALAGTKITLVVELD
jgi:osmotically inducible protein OsmC